MNAAVLPLPVIAQASTSRPVRAGGIASRWIGVGTVKPSASTARSRSGCRVNDANDMNRDPREGTLWARQSSADVNTPRTRKDSGNAV